MRLPRPVVALSALLLCVALATPASANDRLREIEEEIAEKRSRIEDAEAQKDSLLDQIAESDSRLDEINATLSELQGLLEDAHQRLAPVQSAFVLAVARHRTLVKQVETTERELEGQLETLGRRASASYQYGPGTWFDIAFSSSSFGDLIARQELASSVLLFDSEIVDEIEATKARLTRERNEANAARRDIGKRRDALKSEVERVQRLVEKQA